MQGISCDNISKSYENGKKALDGIGFSFGERGIISVIGRNGAGKTTLTRILATELMPNSGHAEIDGIDVVADPGPIRERIAIVPQESRPIGWLTCKQAVVTYLLYRGYGYSEASSRAMESLRKIGIDQYANTLSRKLSGGTKRKLTIATVLASDAKIIFLDEPTTGLDPISRNELWGMLEHLKKDYLIFLTTHYLEEAERLADKIAIMEMGRLLAFGTMDELRKKVRYEYAIRIGDRKRPRCKLKEGAYVTGSDGTEQIFTSKAEAFTISQQLIKEGTSFSSNPLSLEDIFYYIVKMRLSEDYGEK
jgi:ABC-2 type transport system ATP-binding protein